jgi:hypothetical protein
MGTIGAIRLNRSGWIYKITEHEKRYAGKLRILVCAYASEKMREREV